MTELPMRERLARVTYAKLTNNCLVPFQDQGRLMRNQVFDIVDGIASELLFPSEPMVAAGFHKETGVSVSAAYWCFHRMMRALKEGK